MRFDAPEPFEGSFVAYSECWTVRERREVFALNGEEYLALLRGKIVGIRLEVEGGEAIESPADLVQERYDDVDGRLWDWFRSTPLAALEAGMRMGEAMRLQLFKTPETAASAESPNP